MKKEEFLKEFDIYSDKFLDSIPLTANAYINWMLYSDDFRQFVETGKLPTQIDKENKESEDV
jgi:hypothetical protein